jgi:peptidoglycan/LPS O-acetylase OafA/YrhL
MVRVSHLHFAMSVIREWEPSYSVPHWLGHSMGACGVDNFFVISGYVISLTAAR